MRQVVIAIETIGSKVSASRRVVEIACAELLDDKITGNTFHVYLNPEQLIDQVDIERTELTNEYLVDKPYFHKVANEFLEFLDSDELIIFKASDVLIPLHHELDLLDNDVHTIVKNGFKEILKIAKQKHPKQKNSFDDLCDRYYIDKTKFDYSRGLLDAIIIAYLFLALKDDNSKNITSDLSLYEESENLVRVKSFSELDDAIEGLSRTALYRGMSDHEYALLPTLFRHSDLTEPDSREDKLMWVFKAHARPHLDLVPQSDIEWLTIAQHHGLPTRLLDWSLSPLVACFFAVQSLSKTDAAIYIYDIGKFKKEEEIDPSKLKEIVAFFPSHASKRITAQSGMFTIHPSSCMKLENKSITKIVIPASKKKYFLNKLVKYGVHHGTIFPELDGLSSYLRYLNNYS
jgi:DNA polymerase III epsilon subunit